MRTISDASEKLWKKINKNNFGHSGKSLEKNK